MTQSFVTLDSNVQYCYEDSGVPNCDIYTTLVFIHGLGFNAAIFKKLVSLAVRHECRVISLYRRDYAPSTPFTETEISPCRTGGDQEDFLRLRGVEIAKFLLAFIRANNIPQASGPSGEGGIVVIGWSLGAMHVHAMLAFLDALTKEAVAELERYLRTIIFHGQVHRQNSSTAAMGLPHSHLGDMSMWSNQNIEERLKLFAKWTTSYYEHPDILSKDLGHPELYLEFNTPSNTKSPSLHDISPQEFAGLTAINAFAGSDLATLAINENIRKTLTERAIFNRVLASRYLPGVRVVYMCGGETLGALVYAMWMLEKAADNPKSYFGDDAQKARVMEFCYLPKGNHFFFWDDPKWALDQYLSWA
ncbi:hypothetical protein BJ138DRAFT_1111960 [Hygrophoropsis aurantiaca]|uniref:Uncharacterized protein n=1 Tax=Hygrophoropsis aurantiaca TaxID=72124 RepID=A0ACB8AI21_9AGAM|nr:hypothetical protein BJ138DRAFT_1111960 [Hygrophoropsis aurantiaca]